MNNAFYQILFVQIIRPHAISAGFPCSEAAETAAPAVGHDPGWQTR